MSWKRSCKNASTDWPGSATSPRATLDLSYRSEMLRETVGFAYAVERNLRVKTSAEYYHLTDRDANRRMDDVAIHAGVTGTF
jgi:hypothetical protein